MTTDILDVVYRLRDMAAAAADQLRTEIAAAQTVLDRLDRFAAGAEDTAQLAAASDLFPTASALIPEGARLIRPVGPEVGPLGDFLALDYTQQRTAVRKLHVGHSGDDHMPQATYGSVLAERIAKLGLVGQLRDILRGDIDEAPITITEAEPWSAKERDGA